MGRQIKVCLFCTLEFSINLIWNKWLKCVRTHLVNPNSPKKSRRRSPRPPATAPPFQHILDPPLERLSLRQTRHLAFISEFTTDIRYVKEETNFVADALSRPSVSAIGSASAINHKELSEYQVLDTKSTRLRHSTSSTLNFKLLKSFDNNLIWCDVSIGHTRPYITEYRHR